MDRRRKNYNNGYYTTMTITMMINTIIMEVTITIMIIEDTIKDIKTIKTKDIIDIMITNSFLL